MPPLIFEKKEHEEKDLILALIPIKNKNDNIHKAKLKKQMTRDKY